MTRRNDKSMDEIIRKARETLRQSKDRLNESESYRDSREPPSEEGKAKKKEEEGSFVDDIVDGIDETVTAARRVNKAYDAAVDVYRTVRKYSGPVGDATAFVYGKLKSAFMWAAFEREPGTVKLDADKKPVYSWLGRAFKAVAGEERTKNLAWDLFYQFNPSTYKRDADGDLVFSKARLGKVMSSVIAGAFALNLGAQAAYYHGTKFEEYILVTGGKQEVEDGTTFQFTGCSELPCDSKSDNGKFYRINYSLYWPHMVYPEEDVFSLVPETNGLCQVNGYGVYYRNPVFRMLYKNFSALYQNAESVDCVPVTDQMVQGLFHEGTSLKEAWKEMRESIKAPVVQEQGSSASLSVTPEMNVS